MGPSRKNHLDTPDLDTFASELFLIRVFFKSKSHFIVLALMESGDCLLHDQIDWFYVTLQITHGLLSMDILGHNLNRNLFLHGPWPYASPVAQHFLLLAV